jgi:predicted Rossmann fold nucleotide-binding protein DprA/Smf involved in DNA uptake
MHDFEISNESIVAILLCSHVLALKGDDISVSPLSPGEWHKLKEQIPLEKLPGLLDLSSDDLASTFGLPVELSNRISSLLKRGGNLALELERFFQKGIWVLTEFDENYPIRFREKLEHKAPPVIFGAGDQALLNEGGIAIVGSRDVDDCGRIFTENLAELCAREKKNVISGAARGVDRIAMSFALQAGGKVVGVLADSLESFLAGSQIRDSILEGNLTAITNLHPSVGFTVSNAMARNKLIYTLSDNAVVVSSALKTGGTWHGATEALNHQYARVFVRQAENTPDGNIALIDKGAIAIPHDPDMNIVEFIEEQSNRLSEQIKSEMAPETSLELSPEMSSEKQTPSKPTKPKEQLLFDMKD